MASSRNQGYHPAVPYNEDSGILGSTLESPCFGKLSYE